MAHMYVDSAWRRVPDFQPSSSSNNLRAHNPTRMRLVSYLPPEDSPRLHLGRRHPKRILRRRTRRMRRDVIVGPIHLREPSRSSTSRSTKPQIPHISQELTEIPSTSLHVFAQFFEIYADVPKLGRGIPITWSASSVRVPIRPRGDPFPSPRFPCLFAERIKPAVLKVAAGTNIERAPSVHVGCFWKFKATNRTKMLVG